MLNIQIHIEKSSNFCILGYCPFNITHFGQIVGGGDNNGKKLYLIVFIESIFYKHKIKLQTLLSHFSHFIKILHKLKRFEFKRTFTTAIRRKLTLMLI